jgi:class 3 adenylate cyclase
VRVDVGKGRLIGVPEDPTLAQVLQAWGDAGHAALAVDRHWRIAGITAELASLVRDEIVLGEFYFGPVQVAAMLQGRAGLNTIEEVRENFSRRSPWILEDIPGGRDALREMVHPALRDLVDELEPRGDAALSYESPTTAFGGRIGSTTMVERVRDASGQTVGTVVSTKPAVGMRTLFLLAAAGDLGHFERMQRLAAGNRRPAAILFADLEGSAQLAKRLPTASYFTLVRRLTRAADQCVIDAGGLVGRHVGDGVTSFFVAETAGSESAAARACIQTVRDLQAAMLTLAARHDLNRDDVSIRAGLHWGTPYIGSIITPGRTEVTALGDEVNEAARIEACATGGRALASKNLIERLGHADAAALGIDPNHITYNQLADLDTATDKARRDAPAVPVYDINVTR